MNRMGLRHAYLVGVFMGILLSASIVFAVMSVRATLSHVVTLPPCTEAAKVGQYGILLGDDGRPCSNCCVDNDRLPR